MDNNKCEVFISYSRADYIDAERNVIPGNAISMIKEAFDEAGVTYWFDEDGIYAGDPFASSVAKAIYYCDVFLYISSERSNLSPWISNEVAMAFANKKKIIPVRIDDSSYNESIALYIQNLDYVDYSANPDKAMARLVSSVTGFLSRQRKLRAEQERKAREEEERMRLEQEQEQERLRLKKEKEQADLAVEVELSARELNADEGRAQDKRRRITREVQKIEDEEVRNRLVELIDKSGPMHQEQKAERARFTSEIDSLNGEVKSLKGEVEALVSEVEELNGKLTEQKVASKPSFWTLLDNKWVFAGVSALAVVFVFLIVALWGQSGVIDSLESEVDSAESRIKGYESTIEEYETCIRENLVKLEVSSSSTNISAPKIYLNYQILTDPPAKFKFPDGRIELGVHASYGEIQEDSYWIFTPKGSSGVTDVRLSDIVYKVLDQVDISGENFISIPITFTYCGEKLCSTTVRFIGKELERYEEIKQRRSQGKNESPSEI
jgi:hypothetical protein